MKMFTVSILLLLSIYVFAGTNVTKTDTLFVEDFESGSSHWNFTGNWAVVEEGEYNSATHSLTESPDSNYLVNENTTATLLNSIDLSGYWNSTIYFWCKYDIEADFDYMYLEASRDSATWSNLKRWDGEGVDWHEESISLGVFCGDSEVYLRFRFESDPGLELNGMYIDDIVIVGTNETSQPVIDHSPYEPNFFEGTSDEYTNLVDVYPVAPLSAVEVIYYVDSLAQPNISATFVSGTQWEFTIPIQAPGSLIEYTFWAQDITMVDSYADNTYSIISGDHKIYDSGVASYYNETFSGDARAVKIDPISMSEQLLYILIRNYRNIGVVSDNMTVRVWQDDGTGKPGIEIIPPFDITPAVNTSEENIGVTVVDLKEYNVAPVGDFWVGFSSDNGSVYSVEEMPDYDMVPAYDRSYEGIYIGGGVWNWTLDAGSNYHIRVVIGSYDGIEDVYLPSATSLEQNYPNPFNPNTTINFSVAQDKSQIKLLVYNVSGQVVSTLFDGVKNIGKHSAIFDATALNSGVYYYTLEVNEVKEATKKMVLIK